MVIGQRLVPQICPDSKEAVPVSDSIKTMIDKEFADLPAEAKAKIQIPSEVYRAKPSASCPNGTKGRTGVFEVITMDHELEKLILKNPVEPEIYDFIRARGFLTMKEDAMQKAFSGIIPFEEVSKL